MVVFTERTGRCLFFFFDGDEGIKYSLTAEDMFEGGVLGLTSALEISPPDPSSSSLMRFGGQLLMFNDNCGVERTMLGLIL